MISCVTILTRRRDKNLDARKSDFEKTTKSYRPLVPSSTERELTDQLDRQWQNSSPRPRRCGRSLSRGSAQASRSTPTRWFGRPRDGQFAHWAGRFQRQGRRDGGRVLTNLLARRLPDERNPSFAMIFGIGAAAFVSQNSPRHRLILKPMGRLVDGELTIDIPHQVEMTEISQIATASDFQGRADREKASGRGGRCGKSARSGPCATYQRRNEGLRGDGWRDGRLARGASTELELRHDAVLDRGPCAGIGDDGRAASEEASTNVQSVASATEELSSSINGISRQVQEFRTHGVDRRRRGRYDQRPC